jgi:hypothetical protein
MTFLLLLMSLPSYLPCLRQHILGITPGLSFLGNPSRPRIRLIPAQLLTSTESVGRFTPFLILVLRRFRTVLFTGFFGVNPGQSYICQAAILYLLVKPITHVGLFMITMIQMHIRLRYP